MRLAHAEIENFRQIQSLALDFTDPLGRVRDLTVFSGPNRSGKTTVIDALACAIGPSTDLRHRRVGLDLTPRSIVRRGALKARVSCDVVFADSEVEIACQLLDLAEKKWPKPRSGKVRLSWEYPDEKGALGFTHYAPKSGRSLFAGRRIVADLLKTGMIDSSWFQRVGGVFTFDQQRTGMAKMIPPSVWGVISSKDTEQISREDRRTSDPRMLLLSILVGSQAKPVFANGNAGGADGDLTRIQKIFAEICAPQRISGLAKDELGNLDVLFTDGHSDYGYDSLSSGEQMTLLFLVRVAMEHIHRSIVLIDEIELHLHPVWQRQLIHRLPLMGSSNQFIVTTHSPYLRDIVPATAVIELGDLGDVVRARTK